ncbi:hypothetical protein E2C01_077953 [Portunus trituberculatus]|uniref:Uncharacterized protein n=1 Tax=Portunus trituberculatus TaxID=210409 RepID=A0A5B7IRG4_PORTR|nr:hypothetical protein [Portunus trituberculatus]
MGHYCIYTLFPVTRTKTSHLSGRRTPKDSNNEAVHGPAHRTRARACTSPRGPFSLSQGRPASTLVTGHPSSTRPPASRYSFCGGCTVPENRSAATRPRTCTAAMQRSARITPAVVSSNTMKSSVKRVLHAEPRASLPHSSHSHLAFG